jgi:hypothetical protein
MLFFFSPFFFLQAAFEEMTEVTVVALVKRFKKQLSHPKYKQACSCQLLQASSVTFPF